MKAEENVESSEETEKSEGSEESDSPRDLEEDAAHGPSPFVRPSLHNIHSAKSGCKHVVGDPFCILSCWTDAVLDPRHAAIWRKYCASHRGDDPTLDDQIREYFLSKVIPRLLPILQSTGVDKQGCLRVYSPFGSCPSVVKTHRNPYPDSR